ncbi:rod-binding protein [Limimaricola pyoseonensis]|uniref:Rod binding protein n=1 Tax=Limimaricola pyoseonensis TaxID=521013 RepID=A0A1G7KBI2_9RHOB|nr:rod-binding protein [Limimaricola pyoseonensis]SDF34522.1 Rod binding protein [Limimaricola pyoseonensis]
MDPTLTAISPRQPAARLEATSTGAVSDKAREFEAMFLAQTVDEMLKSVDLGGIGGGHATEQWRSFLARAFADEMAAQGTTGIAQNIQRAIDQYGKGEGGA